MENLEALAPERITEFLSGSAGIDFTRQSRTERYAWLQAALTEQQYFSLARKQRSVTVEDLESLMEVDRAHQRLSGPATRRIFEREWQVFGRKEYARLAEISVGASVQPAP